MKQIKTINFIVGSSGSGKDEVLKILTNKIKHSIFVKSYTTRLPRENEANGEHYYFVNNKTFDEIKPELMESTVIEGIYYGHTSSTITYGISGHLNHFFLIIEPNGIYQILKWFKENPTGKDLSITYDIQFRIIHVKTKKSIRLKRLPSSVNKNLEYEDDFKHCDKIIKRIQRDDDNIDSILDYHMDNTYMELEPYLKYTPVENNDTIMTLTTKYLSEIIEKASDVDYYNIP